MVYKPLQEPRDFTIPHRNPIVSGFLYLQSVMQKVLSSCCIQTLAPSPHPIPQQGRGLSLVVTGEHLPMGQHQLGQRHGWWGDEPKRLLPQRLFGVKTEGQYRVPKREKGSDKCWKRTNLMWESSKYYSFNKFDKALIERNVPTYFKVYIIDYRLLYLLKTLINEPLEILLRTLKC